MRISDFGEFPLIDRLERLVVSTGAGVVIGIGDDTAVLEGCGGWYRLATVDAQVETVHFLRDQITPQQLGWRALAVNLSDIAAMGGEPQFALASLVLTNDTPVTWVEGLYEGLQTLAGRYGIAVVGGNMARTPRDVVVDVCMLGKVKQEEVLLRSGARPGDLVLVTGSLGEAAAGLRIMLEPERFEEVAEREELLKRFLAPTPRLTEGGLIAQTRQASAMLDLSDGLSSDLGHICERSKVGVRVWADRLPVSEGVQQVAQAAGLSVLDLCLAGGEDYELCFTVSPTEVNSLMRTVEKSTSTPVTVVGEVLAPEQGRHLLFPNGHVVPLENKGWQHFKKE